jgi:HlyD family secretion protein
VFDHQVPEIRPGMTADVDIATGTHERTLAVPIQAVLIRTQSQLDRAARKEGKREKRKTSSLAADEDTVGKRDPELSGVMVVVDGVTRFVPVRTGLASETMIEVMGELKEGDVVVSGPYKALREIKPGAKVKKEEAAQRGGK